MEAMAHRNRWFTYSPFLIGKSTCEYGLLVGG
jgi:hypothetical protein